MYKRSFYLLVTSDNLTFYQDSLLGKTHDIMLAKRYASHEDAQEELEKLKNKDIWSAKKVTITIE